jgi:hypothetical protein
VSNLNVNLEGYFKLYFIIGNVGHLTPPVLTERLS